ncbi:MAG: aldo/keto reductase [Clostridiales Family XIII bacterium]|jgi:predicted aldo/keto reductase-like oxidoreductase|nr:aldo/keto reductase [Clostridiales Family XIII bacterium]
MENRVLGKSGIVVSRFGMGVLPIGKSHMNLDLDAGQAIIRYALERGITFFDTAEYYETYPYIRAALKDSKTEPILCSKSLARDYNSMARSIDEMRAYFDRDVLDIFLLHEVREFPDFEDRSGAWRCLCDAKAKGIVRAIGLSTHHVDVARLNADLPESDVLFTLINKDGLGIRDGKNAGTREAMEEAIRQNSDVGKGVYAMKVFGGGNLVKDYSEALDYVSHLPGIDAIMVGLGSIPEADALVAYANGQLSPEYKVNLSNKKIRIVECDCEGCGSCMPRCPNKAISIGQNKCAQINYDVCITCGYCAPICPVRAIVLF